MLRVRAALLFKNALPRANQIARKAFSTRGLRVPYLEHNRKQLSYVGPFWAQNGRKLHAPLDQSNPTFADL